MSYILLGSDENVRAHPLKKVTGLTLSVNNNDEEHTAVVRLSIEGASATKIYDEKGNASVVESAKVLYREVLDGLINEKPVNLSDFELTEPKKVAAKKTTPAKKTAPEAPAGQPSE